jgi:hypothetical protein
MRATHPSGRTTLFSLLIFSLKCVDLSFYLSSISIRRTSWQASTHDALRAPPTHAASHHHHGVPALPLLQAHNLSPIAPSPHAYYAPPIQSSYVETEDGSSDEDVVALASEPSVDFVRRTWWDHLLLLYSPSGQLVTGSTREIAARAVISDVKFLFRSTSYWFSFMHARRFFSLLADPVRRANMQPSLVLAALATARLLQSSEYGEGRLGMHKALLLRDEAQAKLDASLNAGAIDEELAQAAWVSFLRFQQHPLRIYLPRATAATSASVRYCLHLRCVDGCCPYDVSRPCGRSYAGAIVRAPLIPHAPHVLFAAAS